MSQQHRPQPYPTGSALMGLSYEEFELRKAEALLNPTPGAAMQFWSLDWEPPRNDDVLLAGLHKTRLKWEHTTPAMADESRRWLAAHGYTGRTQYFPRMCQ